MTEGERTLLDGLRRATLDPFADPVFVFGTIRLSRATARAMEAQLARLKVAEDRRIRLLGPSNAGRLPSGRLGLASRPSGESALPGGGLAGGLWPAAASPSLPSAVVACGSETIPGIGGMRGTRPTGPQGRPPARNGHAAQRSASSEDDRAEARS